MEPVDQRGRGITEFLRRTGCAGDSITAFAVIIGSRSAQVKESVVFCALITAMAVLFCKNT